MFDIKVVQTKLFAKVTKVSRMNEEAVNTMYMSASNLFGEGISDGWYRRRAPDQLGQSTVHAGTFAGPAVLVLDGENFQGASQVLISGRDAMFELVTDQRIFAIVPPSLEQGAEGEGHLSQEIFVVTDSQNFANASIMTYGFGNRLQKTVGPGKLCSQIVKLLMTTQGTDDFEPWTGASLRSLPGSKIRSGADLTVPVVMAVKRVEEHLKASQSTPGTKLHPSEKLRTIDVIGMNYDNARPGVLELTLKVNTLGQESVAMQMMTGAEKLLEDVIKGNLSVKDNTVVG
jgi:hypothetical protein